MGLITNLMMAVFINLPQLLFIYTIIGLICLIVFAIIAGYNGKMIKTSDCMICLVWFVPLSLLIGAVIASIVFGIKERKNKKKNIKEIK